MSFTTVIVNLTAKPGQRDALLAMLSKAIQHTITKPDCYKIELVVDDDDDDRCSMVQHWTTPEAHKEYSAAVVKDPKFAPVMEVLAGPPEARYFSHHSAGGGDWGGPQHLELSSMDTEATKKFLTDVFDWRFNQMMEGYDGFWTPGALMGGLRPKMDEEPAPQAIPYLVVDDLDARLEAVKAAGGTITVPIQEVKGAGRFFWFVAPGGIGLAAWESKHS